ncbi:ABC transporter permease [Oryzomicrobium sp.]|uniref:ABC transporter permease n=1 Tax=Oryzomicrobium sp. TaxID=1911578 RepID=UPI002FE3CA7F
MNNTGLFRIAYKLLVNDAAKFSALLIGITFAVFLMVQMTSMFAGILDRSSATVTNVGASMWVMDPAVNTVANTIPVPDYLLDAVRSIDGVKFAVPLYSGGGLAKLRDGTYQSVNILGLDDTSLFGRPPLEKGKIEDIFGENGFVVVRDAEFRKLHNPTIGTEFELNDHRAVVVGIARVVSSGLFGVPTLYTTYSRAIQYLPNGRFTMSYILVEPKQSSDTLRIQAEVKRLGYLALTKEEFDQRIADFYKYQTGVGTNIMIMTIVSFIVGLSISGQTFYTFILENLEKFGALKAIGAKGHELVAMILFQALFTALTGYGLGVGLCAALIALVRLRIPDYAAIVTYTNLGLAFIMVLLIAGISSYFGVRRVLRIEPFEIFRG